MRKGRTFFLILVALVMAFLAVVFANRVINQFAQKAPTTGTTSAQVVIAKLRIPYGEKIVSAALATKFVDESLIEENTFSDITEVEGKVALSDIYPGEIIINERVAETLGGASLASLITESKRAVSVRVNDVIGVAGFLLPGNTVDILHSRTVNGRLRSTTLLQNIKVLAVDQIASSNKDEPVVVRAVTLELSPPESEELFAAIQSGSIQLTLRNPLDTALVEQYVEPPPEPAPEPVAIEAPPAPPPPPPVSVVTIIRGTTVDEEKL